METDDDDVLLKTTCKSDNAFAPKQRVFFHARKMFKQFLRVPSTKLRTFNPRTCFRYSP